MSSRESAREGRERDIEDAHPSQSYSTVSYSTMPQSHRTTATFSNAAFSYASLDLKGRTVAVPAIFLHYNI